MSTSPWEFTMSSKWQWSNQIHDTEAFHFPCNKKNSRPQDLERWWRQTPQTRMGWFWWITLLAVHEPLTVDIRVYCLDFGLGLPTACRKRLRFLSQQVPMLRDKTRQSTAGNSMKLLSNLHWKILSHLDLAPSGVPDLGARQPKSCWGR
jgi:hypothetical protein